MKKIKKIRSLFMKKEAGKDVINRRRIFLCFGLVIFLGSISVILFNTQEDTSVIINASDPIKKEKMRVRDDSKETPSTQKVNEMLLASEKVSHHQVRQSSDMPNRFIKDIEYKAPQVIERKGVDGLGKGLPLGTNLIGKLLTTIDTREKEQFYQVLLPYGGKDKNGGSVPKNTIAFGRIGYSGKGRKVFIQFTKALLPDGSEVKLKAQALNSKDYSPGLMGDFHGKRTERIAATLGLTMVSAMTDTLTEREALGTNSTSNTTLATEVTPKATAKNAFYQGLSKVSEMEAQRQAVELGTQEEYVMIPSGKEMIVNLISTYYGDQ